MGLLPMSNEALQKLDVIKRRDEHEVSRTQAAPLLDRSIRQMHNPANMNTQSGHREHLSLPAHHEATF